LGHGGTSGRNRSAGGHIETRSSRSRANEPRLAPVDRDELDRVRDALQLRRPGLRDPEARSAVREALAAREDLASAGERPDPRRDVDPLSRVIIVGAVEGAAGVETDS